MLKKEQQMIEERLESLIERYTIEIEDEKKKKKNYKDALEDVLKESDCLSEVDISLIGSLHKIVERKANEILLKKEFLLDLKYMKGENMIIQNEDVFIVFKTLLSLNSDYLINKIESTNKIKNNKEYIIGSIDENGIITIILN